MGMELVVTNTWRNGGKLMSQEVLDIVQGMDVHNMELQIAFQCAPLIAGLKMANLLMVEPDQMVQVHRLLRGSGLSYFVVAAGSGKTAVLLYQRSSLEQYLKRPCVWEIFASLGYDRQCLGKLLYAFRLRYEAYLQKKGGFPHEMGLLLGYPVEDVEGYMKYQGKQCLWSGEWKVYAYPGEKKALFASFDKAREELICKLHQGVAMHQIIEDYSTARRGMERMGVSG